MPSKTRSVSKRKKRSRSKYKQIIVPFTVPFPNAFSQANVNATSYRSNSQRAQSIQSLSSLSPSQRAQSIQSLSSLSPSQRSQSIQSISSIQTLPELESVTSSSSTLDLNEDKNTSRSLQTYKRSMPHFSPSDARSGVIPLFNINRNDMSRRMEEYRRPMPMSSPSQAPAIVALWDDGKAYQVGDSSQVNDMANSLRQTGATAQYLIRQPEGTSADMGKMIRDAQEMKRWVEREEMLENSRRQLQ